MKDWIKTEEKLPEIGEPVLVYMPKFRVPSIDVMWRVGDHSWMNIGCTVIMIDEGTHWMPLPKLP